MSAVPSFRASFESLGLARAQEGVRFLNRLRAPSPPWGRQMKQATRIGLTLFSIFAAAACGGDDGDGNETQGETTGASEIDPGVLVRTTDGSDPGEYGGLDENGSCQGLDVGDSCAGEVYEGEAVPLDLYLMFDQSGSMSTKVDEEGTTRMDIVRTAVRTFLQDEESSGMGAGLGYFGHQPLRETTCDPGDYSDADVDMGALPGLTDELIGSLEKREPTGETPTGAAIRGACRYVSTFRDEHPGRSPAILLITDGEPKAPLSQDQCAPTLDDAVAAAEECYEEEGIRIYVLGVGPSLTNLRVIAEAGGTEEAFLADRDNAEQVLEAFRAVRHAAQLPCTLSVGSDAFQEGEVDVSASTVAYLDFQCGYNPIEHRDSAQDCDETGGWYFDDPAEPTQIELCDVTCGNVKSSGRQLFYSIGCSLEVVVR